MLTSIFCVLQEEEDLVSAHRRQVEETMDLVREVCDSLCSLFLFSSFKRANFIIILGPRYGFEVYIWCMFSAFSH